MDALSTKYLPGGFDQYILFNKTVELKDKNILFIGAGLEKLLVKIERSLYSSIFYIVDDHDSLLTTRFLLSDLKDINIRLMQFDSTDFANENFDIVYTQGSVSSSKRNKIVKEIKRILKPGGIFCVGESVLLKDNEPQFIKDIYKNSDTLPLAVNNFTEYYISRKFEIIKEADFSYSLRKYYKSWKDLSKENINSLSEEEKQQNKKIIKRISHESNAYNNLGGSKYMGFKMLILKKERDEKR